jgi:transcriptional regulator with XRE-family HTH domain
MKNFPEFLEELRQAKQISKKDLAARSGLTPGYISLLTRGERTAPSEDTVNALADALNLDAETKTLLFESAGYPSYVASSISDDLELGRVPKSTRLLWTPNRTGYTKAMDYR